VGVEFRKGRPYWYERKRVNGLHRAEYVCPLSADGATLLRQSTAATSARLATDRRAAHATISHADAVLDAGAAFDRLADRVFRAVMVLTGHRLHRRSECRCKRGGGR
jgi:hypothetical protein